MRPPQTDKHTILSAGNSPVYSAINSLPNNSRRNFISIFSSIPVYFLLLITAISLFCVFVRADEKTAREFLVQGDAVIKKGDIERAVRLYQMALNEEPNLPEAYFKLGEAYLKLNDKSKCRNAFKKCIRFIDKQARATPALKELKKQAETKLAVIEVVRKEAQKIEAEYVMELLTFANRIKLKDKSFTEEVLQLVSEIDPANPEAGKLLNEIRQSRTISIWESLFNGKDLDGWSPGTPGDWKIETENEMVCDTYEFRANASNKITVSGSFTISLEFKVEKSYASEKNSGGVGLVFGTPGPAGQKSLLVLWHIQSLGLCNLISDPKTQTTQLEWLKTPTFKEKFTETNWNTLKAEISDGKIKAYLNDKLLLEYKDDDKFSFNGEIRLCVQNGRIVFRNIKCLK